MLILCGAAWAEPATPENAILQLEEQQKKSLAAEDLASPSWEQAGSSQVESLSRVDLRDPQVQVYDGRTAIVTGVWDIAGLQDGRPVESARRFTHVWVQVDDGWKLVSRHLAAE